MHNSRTIVILIVTYFLTNFAWAAEKAPLPSAQDPKVVVSIPPFYAFVAEIMKGAGKPELLISSGASSHHAVLSPKNIQSLENAELIFWGGPNLETFLIRPIKNVDPNKTKIVALEDTPKLRLLRTRTSENFSDDENDSDHSSHHYSHSHTNAHSHAHTHTHTDTHAEHDHAHTHGINDMHFWLDPYNGLLLIDHITETLGQRFPEKKTQFEKNAEELKQNIKQLDSNLKVKLAKIQNKPYIVMHDGYQYFEKHYHLKAVGAITHHPDMPISIARMQKVRKMITKDKVECIFSEPSPTESKLAANLAKEFHLRTGILDPMERPDTQGNYSYENLLNGLANSLINCLTH